MNKNLGMGKTMNQISELSPILGFIFRYSFLAIALIAVATPIQSQGLSFPPGTFINLNPSQFQLTDFSTLTINSSTKLFIDREELPKLNQLLNIKVTTPFSPLGVFCAFDDKMDSKLPFKMRFRLGTFQETYLKEYGEMPGVNW